VETLANSAMNHPSNLSIWGVAGLTKVSMAAGKYSKRLIAQKLPVTVLLANRGLVVVVNRNEVTT